VPYFSLGEEVLRKIIRLQLGRIGGRIQQNYRARFEYDEALIATIAARCNESADSGARNVDHILTGTLLPDISREFLARMAEGKEIAGVHVSVDGNGKFVYRID
jgi:type VI secretion system protein VasG